MPKNSSDNPTSFIDYCFSNDFKQDLAKSYSTFVTTVGHYPLPAAIIFGGFIALFASTTTSVGLAATLSTCTALAAGAFVMDCYYKTNYQVGIGTTNLARNLMNDLGMLTRG
jgi:hypothetical protein